MKRTWHIFVLCIASMTLLVACLAQPIETVDDSLVGTWHGETEIALPVVFNPGELDETVERTRSTIEVNLVIHEDGTVEGVVGEAVLEGCILKSNRGELGRTLNLATDYLIADGSLVGSIVPGEDETDVKSFTIPFNVDDGHLRGSVMWTQEWKYPFPLSGLDLQHIAPN